jgi:hypothetical protein
VSNPKSPYREDPAPKLATSRSGRGSKLATSHSGRGSKLATSHSGRGSKHKSLGNTKSSFYKPVVQKYYFGGNYQSLNNLNDEPGRPTLGNTLEVSIDEFSTPSEYDHPKSRLENDKSEVTIDGKCKKNGFNELYPN